LFNVTKGQNMKSFKFLATATFVSAAFCSASATASTIFLLGTDAISLHGDATYRDPVFSQLAQGASKPVLVLSNFGASYASTGSATVVYKSYAEFASLNLGDYGAIFAASPYGCCGDAGYSQFGAGADTAIANFVQSGGNLAVEDYQGSAFWDAALGFTGAPGVLNTLTGIDPGVSTASGLAFGFEPSYSEGYFVHQTYDPAFWTAHGYFALQRAGSETGPFATMASGFQEPGTVPEPGSMALLGLGALGIASARRKAAPRAKG
jgi:hypothetical protein